MRRQNAESEVPAHQQDQRMNQAPQPSDGRADEALLEIAADQLEQQAAPFDQISGEMRSGESCRHGKNLQIP